MISLHACFTLNTSSSQPTYTFSPSFSLKLPPLLLQQVPYRSDINIIQGHKLFLHQLQFNFSTTKYSLKNKKEIKKGHSRQQNPHELIKGKKCSQTLATPTGLGLRGEGESVFFSQGPIFLFLFGLLCSYLQQLSAFGQGHNKVQEPPPSKIS